jgi:hypothetical protein
MQGGFTPYAKAQALNRNRQFNMRKQRERSTDKKSEMIFSALT